MESSFLVKIALLCAIIAAPNIGHSQVGYHVSAGVTKISPVQNDILVNLFVVVADEKGNAVDGFDQTPTGPASVRRNMSVEARVCDATGSSCQFKRMTTKKPIKSGADYYLDATLPFSEGTSLVQGKKALFLVRASSFSGIAAGAAVVGSGIAVAETIGTP